MSGNPFRLSTLPTTQNQSSVKPAPPVRFLSSPNSAREQVAVQYDAESSRPQHPARTKKSVRIETPPSSPPHSTAPSVEAHRAAHNDHAGTSSSFSPLLGLSDEFGNQLDDAPSRMGYNKNVHNQRTVMDREDPVRSMRAPATAPVNPFSRTLATIEPHERADSQSVGQHNERRPNESPIQVSAKGNLDVDGFKRLLMTGISSPSGENKHLQSANSPNPRSAFFDSSNSTDTSSGSRQSIFENMQSLHTESPRTPNETSSSEEDAHDPVVNSQPQEKKKPPLPKHRHGKLVNARTPQTVPFDDFAAEAPTGSISVRSTRANSDLNKPLPPPPTASISLTVDNVVQNKIPDDTLSIDTVSNEATTPPDQPAVQKKIPPPIPIARRQSQLRTSTLGNRPRSDSSLTISSQHSIELPVPSPNPRSDPVSSAAQRASGPPPPPPARRHGANLFGGTASSASSSTTELPVTSSLRSSVPLSSTSRSRSSTLSSPPPSPGTGQAPLGLGRTASTASNRNAPRSVSNESAPSSMPPPPPPPRRRQSARSSLDKERPSQFASSSPVETPRTSLEYKRNSIDNKRRTSVASESSLRREYTPSENEQTLYSPKEEREESLPAPSTYSATANSSILDDMEQFQREIDALRDKYKENP
ncbi:hypothetical protein BU24DRAFT_172364 [Aaosphaeria arxii CBS 175.79]|uniref:Uncharacterized protein n=1 Tax=Aaosphaeria arxii CBS 175.79 TaxID=1450172 RepID=A0A6A5Y117_9PLEO|nr:uncharacterized protein BU24DRAFT_172364 [Aaosphaeria arxii CBS 175.79]KAF2018500.1 hypothetical protein BU24DRAFT_172364 [Aaosphaeria arxii CBS 175.79]